MNVKKKPLTQRKRNGKLKAMKSRRKYKNLDQVNLKNILNSVNISEDEFNVKWQPQIVLNQMKKQAAKRELHKDFTACITYRNINLK